MVSRILCLDYYYTFVNTEVFMRKGFLYMNKILDAHTRGMRSSAKSLSNLTNHITFNPLQSII